MVLYCYVLCLPCILAASRAPPLSGGGVVPRNGSEAAADSRCKPIVKVSPILRGQYRQWLEPLF
jgi:hypothetical protein